MSGMKIKLAAAHQVTFAEPVPLNNCLGVLQVAACLRQRNIRDIQCDVLDLVEFHYLYYRDFNETMERVSEEFLVSQPDMVGFSTMADNLPIAVEICERIKKKCPAITTILGGPGASFCAREILQAFPWVDVVIRGEAEKAFPDYIDASISGIKNPAVKGSVYRSGKTIIDNGWPSPIDNLDDIPFPAFEFCRDYPAGNDNENLNSINKQPWDFSISLEPGRGCAFNCIFCSTSKFFKRKHRLKSVTRVIEEILYTRERFGNRKVIFNHDILVYHHDYISDLCREIERRVPGLSCRCHARFDTIDDSILKKMRRAGCSEIYLGIETATPRMQKLLNKNLDLTGLEKTLETFRELDYKFCLSFIVGFPEEEPADIEGIFAMALRARHRCGDAVPGSVTRTFFSGISRWRYRPGSWLERLKNAGKRA